MKKVGLLGGTFDPIHNGHLKVAEEIQRKAKLDEIWFIPVRINPLKTHIQPASCKERIEMIRKAIEKFPTFFVNEIECYREGPSYSIDTLRLFKKEYPDIEFFFIVGSDVVTSYEKWKSGPEILEICSIIIVKRPGFDKKSISNFVQNHPKFLFFEISPINISSTLIREKLKKNINISQDVPLEVMEYINQKKLYR